MTNTKNRIDMNKVLKVFISSLLLFLVVGVVPASAKAKWVGESAIRVNNTWYYAGTPLDWCSGGAFNGAKLGAFYGSFLLSGQSHVRDAENSQWEAGATMQMCYKFDDNENYTTLHLTMDKGNWQSPYMEFKLGGAAFYSTTIDISELSVGRHTISVWFYSDEVYDSNDGYNYVAEFTKVYEGGGQENNPFVLNSTDDFENFATMVNNGSFSSNNLFFKLNADLDFTGKIYTPIGTKDKPFCSHFNGNGKTIKGLKLNGDDYIGVFGYIQNGSIENLTVDNDCSITGDEYVGGVAGFNYWGSIQGCTNNATIIGNKYVGGIVGHSEGYVADCCDMGNVQGNQSSGFLGGIVGDNYGTINGCICTSDVTGGYYVGGIVGFFFNSGATMEACIFLGKNVVAANEGSIGALVGLVASNEGDAPSRSFGAARDRDYCAFINNYYVHDFEFGGANGQDIEEYDGAIRGFCLNKAFVSSDAIGQETGLAFPSCGITCFANGLKYGNDYYVMSFVPLYDKGGNNVVLEQYDEETVTIKLVGRTLYTDGDWNTLCLPFDLEDCDEDDDISFTGTLLEGATVMILKSSNFAEGTLSLDFEFASSISAGMPCLVKWKDNNEELEDIVDPRFCNVTINDLDNTWFPTTFVDFIGCFNPVSFATADPNTLYLGAKNTLYYPSGAMNIDAFRAYFKLHLEGVGKEDVKAFKLNFGDVESGIKNINADATPRGEGSWYTLDGRRFDEKPYGNGIFIHNGRKVVSQ